uniref:Uncharacterized protein n=1 Tax=Rangifer tarandus platyrhynchus TaxID=3082113 RepID=A0ACB0E260_RANTA|nr:unnamed protein product [Rangifer tarandus platyrhynchus]
MCRVEPAGCTFPRGAPARAGSPAEASQSPHTGNPGQQTWPGPGARSVSGTPSGRSGVHAWAWGWGEGCGGLGALPPWASPGPPTVSAPPPAHSRSGLRATWPRRCLIRARRGQRPSVL